MRVPNSGDLSGDSSGDLAPRGRRCLVTDQTGPERFEVVRGRSAGPFVIVPLWIVLNSSPKARALYEVLAAHRDWWATGHLVEDATQEDLAALIDVKQARSVRRYLRELEALGAIDIIRRTTESGLNDSSVYVIHDIPPDNFVGPRTLSEYYKQRPKSAGQPVGRSSAPRSNQGEYDTPRDRESDNTGKFGVVPGRTVGRSSAPRGALERPSVGRSSAPLPYKKGVRRTPPSSPPSHTGDEGLGSAPSAREEGDGSSAETAGASVPPPRSAPEENQELVTAREVLASLPEPIKVGARSVRDLAPAVVDALADGWTPETLSAHLSAELPARVRSARALLMHRLGDLPSPPAEKDQEPPLPPRCGDSWHDPLAPHDRLLYPPGEPPRRCPTCHPTALQDGGAR